MKKYTIKNYKGNIVESLTKFAKSHKGMRIVEAIEDEDILRLKTEESELDDSLDLFDEFIRAFAEDLKNAVEDASEDIENKDSYYKMREFFANFYKNGIKKIGLNPMFFRRSMDVGKDFFSDNWPND